MKRFTLVLLVLFTSLGYALEKPNVTYSVFQFPADKIPRVDGNIDDWSMVPESYVVGTDQLWDDSKKHPAPDPKTLDVRVRVGWVKGLNRLYFLYEAYDDYWDFALPGSPGLPLNAYAAFDHGNSLVHVGAPHAIVQSLFTAGVKM